MQCIKCGTLMSVSENGDKLYYRCGFCGHEETWTPPAKKTKNKKNKKQQKLKNN